MFGDGRPNLIRLNDEVRSMFYFLMPKEKAVNFKPGDMITVDEAEHFEIEPPKDEANEAHVVLIRKGSTWAYTFNFTYNSGHIAECFLAAKEFCEVARDSLIKGRVRAFIDNLFSSIELMSKCILIMMPGEIKHSHKYIQTNINKRKKDKVIGGDFASLLNRLSAERDKARYTTAAYIPDEAFLKTMLTEAEQCLKTCESQMSRRAREILQASSHKILETPLGA